MKHGCHSKPLHHHNISVENLGQRLRMRVAEMKADNMAR